MGQGEVIDSIVYLSVLSVLVVKKNEVRSRNKKERMNRYRSQITGHRFQVTDSRSQIPGHRLQVTGHRSQIKIKN